MTTSKTFLLLGAALSATAVAAGAFGAHALRERLSSEMISVFETGARYQIYHGLALLAVGLLAEQYAAPQVRWAGWLFAVGTVIFSGSLYTLSLSGVLTWGAVTPIGGALFLSGWLCLGWGIVRSKP